MTPILVQDDELIEIAQALNMAVREGRYVRFAQDADQIKVKIGEGTWSPGFGTVQR